MYYEHIISWENAFEQIFTPEVEVYTNACVVYVLHKSTQVYICNKMGLVYILMLNVTSTNFSYFSFQVYFQFFHRRCNTRRCRHRAYARTYKLLHKYHSFVYTCASMFIYNSGLGGVKPWQQTHSTQPYTYIQRGWQMCARLNKPFIYIYRNCYVSLRLLHSQ